MEDKRYPLKLLLHWRDSVISFKDSHCVPGLLKSLYIKRIAENEDAPQQDDPLEYFEV